MDQLCRLSSSHSPITPYSRQQTNTVGFSFISEVTVFFSTRFRFLKLVRVKGIEPLAPTWKEGVLAITPNPHYEMVHLVNYDITTYQLSTDCSASELQVVMVLLVGNDPTTRRLNWY